jgi:CRISPR-associated endonuclease/helicase Cas3
MTKAPIAHVKAHVSSGGPPIWFTHDLTEHLLATSGLAGEFAAAFGAQDWARLAGLWHDLGKFSPEFQGYIRAASGYDADAHLEGMPGRVNHSSAGAVQAINSQEQTGHVLAYLIAGHHAGLPDFFATEGRSALQTRLSDARNENLLGRALAGGVPAELLLSEKPTGKIHGGSHGAHLWLRMLFSCLVDADFLDTEAFMDSDNATTRGQYPQLAELHARFNQHMTAFSGATEPTPVNRLRAEILRQCREAAKREAGLFSLTVPTGGGKTLSSLAFALEHANVHDKRRIIYAIPYTSIIEQTAGVFRNIFGEENVVEHHSNFDTDKETRQSRLASENWDAPLIVTTNVQLFESLFAARTSRCRKLHNLVNSVIVLDEAQLLPPEFLQPIMDVINLLAVHYGVTFVLSTATQPALNTVVDGFGRRQRRGLDNVREIIADVDGLYQQLERVEVSLPRDLGQPTDWATLADELCQHETVLAIVNTRNDCRELWRAMPEGTLHLSALMCGEHRSAVIAEIKRKLKAGEPVRVISTQLVEAGVDIDFPVVYRALAGLDSIAQAAGRCNREGRMEGKGRVVVFVPPKPAPKGLLRFGEDACKSVWHDRPEGPLARPLFQRYFDQLFSRADLDRHGIIDMLKCGPNLEIQFRSAADRFRLIDDRETQAVFVCYSDESRRLLDLLRGMGPERWLLRKLQRHAVTLYRHDFDRLLRKGDVFEVWPGLYAQLGDTLYHPQLGLLLENTAVIDPASLLV